jgi:hypothetical protein
MLPATDAALQVGGKFGELQAMIPDWLGFILALVLVGVGIRIGYWYLMRPFRDGF